MSSFIIHALLSLSSCAITHNFLLCCREVSNFASYLVELSLPDYSMLKYPYSMLAASAVYASNLALDRSPAYSHVLQRHSGYSEEQLRDCATALAQLHRKAPNNSLTAVYKKYSR